MLYEICRNLRNYFEYDKKFGKFTIEDGVVSPSFNIENGQYIRIIGSKFNDGIYKFGEDELKDESFEGALWLLAFPSEFLDLVSEIEAYQKKYASEVNPYTSESFNGYSYSKSAVDVSYKSVFKSRLNAWRKI